MLQLPSTELVKETLLACTEMVQRFAADKGELWPETQQAIKANPTKAGEELRKALNVGPIRHNRVMCRSCNTIIESVHRHDYVTCKCSADRPVPAPGVSGAGEYTDLTDGDVFGHGPVAVDGGTWYQRRVGNVGNCENMSELWPWITEEMLDEDD